EGPVEETVAKSGRELMNLYLERLARRVVDDPSFLASALAGYARSEGLDDAGLAARLGCAVPMLAALRLCRMPRPEAPFFWQDVERIAARLAMSPELLAEAVRRGQSLAQWRSVAGPPAEASAGFLMAARDEKAADRPGGKSP